jgi:hypothetical protein
MRESSLTGPTNDLDEIAVAACRPAAYRTATDFSVKRQHLPTPKSQTRKLSAHLDR